MTACSGVLLPPLQISTASDYCFLPSSTKSTCRSAALSPLPHLPRRSHLSWSSSTASHLRSRGFPPSLRRTTPAAPLVLAAAGALQVSPASLALPPPAASPAGLPSDLLHPVFLLLQGVLSATAALCFVAERPFAGLAACLWLPSPYLHPAPAHDIAGQCPIVFLVILHLQTYRITGLPAARRPLCSPVEAPVARGYLAACRSSCCPLIFHATTTDLNRTRCYRARANKASASTFCY